MNYPLNSIMLTFCWLCLLLPAQAQVQPRSQAVAQPRSLSLQQAYELAREKGGFESLKVSRLNVDLAQEQLGQVRGQLMPQVDFSYRLMQQDIPGSGSQAVSSAFREPQQTTSRLTLRQPLFRGFGEYRALEQAHLLKGAEEQNFSQAEIDLFVEVLNRYLALLTAGKEQQTLQALVRGLGQRESELRRRVEIGRSRSADLLSAQAQKIMAQAELLEVEAQLQVAQRRLQESLFAEESGIEMEKIELEELKVSSHELPSLAQLLEELEQAPQFQALSLRLEGARKEVGLRRSAHLPMLDLEANYYFVRPGILRDSQWDGALVLSWPLFAGGVLQSRVTEATVKLQQQELQYVESLRRARVELEAAYTQLGAQVERLELLEKGVALSQKSFEQMLEEYRSGLVTYLEVHQAETAYYQARRSFDRSRVQVQGQWLELQAQVGRSVWESI